MADVDEGTKEDIIMDPTPVSTLYGDRSTRGVQFEDAEVPKHPHVRMEKNAEDACPKDSIHKSEESTPSTVSCIHKLKVPASLQWISANWTWSKLKPVIRCALGAWIAAILFIIPRVQIFLGRASFLILIVPALSPPADPFPAVVERETITCLFVTIAWAWSCLGMRLADLARSFHDPNATLSSAVTGQYLEAGPTIIIAVFIFFGSIFFLYIRARQGIGPYLVGCFLGCICLDISLTSAVLFPFPFYLGGQMIIIPVVFASASSLLVSLTIFPSTVSSQFSTRLQDVLSPLVETMELHRIVLKTAPSTENFAGMVASITQLTGKSESNLTSLAASARLLSSDLVYSRFSPQDFHSFHNLMRRITARANGLETYYASIDPIREGFPVTPAPSIPTTPCMSVTASPGQSRAPSPSRTHHTRESHDDDYSDGASAISPAHHHAPYISSSHHTESHPNLHRRSRGTHSPHVHLPHHLHHILHHKLLLLSHPQKEKAVGVFESQRYLNLQATSLYDPDAKIHTTQSISLLGDSCGDLLSSCALSMNTVRDWLGRVGTGSLKFWTPMTRRVAQWEKSITELQRARDDLALVLEQFLQEKRHQVLDPYHAVFDPMEDSNAALEHPGHRYLFHCYSYQHHLIQCASIIIEMLDDAINLEKKRRTYKLWTPIKRIFRWDIWEIPENVVRDGDENPDVIQGLSPTLLDMEDLGVPRRRDPDALPPRNFPERIMNLFHQIVYSLGRGNFLFAIKAATLTVILCLPFFLKSSASFAYENRFVWAIFMGQLTLARFRGDTVFGLVARIFSTFVGGLAGLVMWYIASGSGSGNPYGLAAVFGVCYPFFLFVRIYWPGPLMINIVFFVTTNLVVGYSWQDSHITFPGNPGFGFSVAWRRFVLVTAGVVSAFIVSFLPPSTTIRRYQRTTLATTSEELGTMYCAILSFANSRKKEMIPDINTGLVAIRSKLRRSIVLKTNVAYEFSFRGRWPAERYQNILDLQLQMAYALSHLFSVVENLEPSWSRALLRRNRFLDSDFQGDVLAVISMISSSLRTGSPLPQITPCPLLDRSMSIYKGLEVIQKEAAEDYGLPRTLSLETLKDLQYLIFCVGVSTSFRIMTRLDRLMVATKEVVGEQYHIHGVGLAHASAIRV